jgi:signal transduction histidine kinase
MRPRFHPILAVQEEERKRISQELHDEAARTLAGIHMQLASLKVAATVRGQGLQHKITSTQRMVGKSVEIVRGFAHDLRPPLLDDLGLIPALLSFMKDFTHRTGIHVHFTTFTSARIDHLGNAKRTALYRVAQEAMRNVARHAQASQVNVTVQRLSSAISMEVADNGRGFEMDRVLFATRTHRSGVVGMRERVRMVGGQFNLESTAGRGTTVRARIPVGKGSAARGKTLTHESTES